MSMADRLRHAREAAGYKTATAAVEHFNWPSSTYRAHENGQNNYSPVIAQLYANAYDVSAAWLLLGDDNQDQRRNSKTRQRSMGLTKRSIIGSSVGADWAYLTVFSPLWQVKGRKPSGL